MSFYYQNIFTQPGDLSMGKIISPEKKKEHLPFIRSHFGKISQREIARRLGIGWTTVRRWSSELGYKHIKHTVNDRFFDVLTENSAYLLGYIYADGNIAWNPQKGYYCLTITSAAKDKEHLERVRALLSSTKPLLFSSKTNFYRLIVNSRYVCERLMMLGVLPKKSLTVQSPHFLPPDYLRHFIRGVIDGDGTVFYLNRKRSPYFSIKLCSGSEEFLVDLAKAIKRHTYISGNVRKTKSSLFIVEYTCSRAKKLGEYIYADASTYLERKYLPYKKNVLEVKENGK